MITTDPLTRFNRVMGKVAHEYRLPKAEAYMNEQFGSGPDAEAARQIFEAHKRRVSGLGSPFECDAVTKETIERRTG